MTGLVVKLMSLLPRSDAPLPDSLLLSLHLP